MATVAAHTTTGEAQLYERHSDLVFRYCLRTLGSREEAEDATQTTFLQALRALRRGVVPQFEQAWLLTIARNECKTRHRAGSRRRRRELAHDPLTLAELAGASDDSEARLAGVRDALTRLPETQRRALLLREWQGRSYAEIAHELGVSRPAVEALIFRARRGLVRELGEERTTRRHAFDLASLLAGLKSLLGGGAAVKVAAGVAAVATVGTFAVSSGTGPGPALPARQTDAVERPAHKAVRQVRAAPAKARRDTPTAVRRRPTVDASAPPARQRVKRPEAQSPAPVAEQPAPRAPVPAAPAPPPTAALPAPPPLPQVPSLPPAPSLPELPPLPAVPELPGVPDVPILP